MTPDKPERDSEASDEVETKTASAEEWAAWEKVAIAQLGTAVSSVRKKQKLSQRGLAELSTVDRGQIANIENGRITELPRLGVIIRLASAMDVPPLVLIYPGIPDGGVEATPNRSMFALHAMKWFSGQEFNRVKGSNDITTALGMSLSRESAIWTIFLDRKRAKEGAQQMPTEQLEYMESRLDELETIIASLGGEIRPWREHLKRTTVSYSDE